MNTLNKQECGTLGAFRWNKGIAFGIYGSGNFACFEYDSEEKQLYLKIRQDLAEEQRVKIQYVNKEWKEI